MGQGQVNLISPAYIGSYFEGPQQQRRCYGIMEPPLHTSKLGILGVVLFSSFNTTHFVEQESVVLSKCCMLHDMTFWPQMSYYQGFS